LGVAAVSLAEAYQCLVVENSCSPVPVQA
jgi:hypothetical protein